MRLAFPALLPNLFAFFKNRCYLYMRVYLAAYRHNVPLSSCLSLSGSHVSVRRLMTVIPSGAVHTSRYYSVYIAANKNLLTSFSSFSCCLKAVCHMFGKFHDEWTNRNAPKSVFPGMFSVPAVIQIYCLCLEKNRKPIRSKHTCNRSTWAVAGLCFYCSVFLMDGVSVLFQMQIWVCFVWLSWIAGYVFFLSSVTQIYCLQWFNWMVICRFAEMKWLSNRVYTWIPSKVGIYFGLCCKAGLFAYTLLNCHWKWKDGFIIYGFFFHIILIVVLLYRSETVCEINIPNI